MPPRHVPVHILSGFLGAGKTTLLNRILSESHGRRYAVIVNEFGEVGLDGSLVAAGSGEFVKMDNGCLCCALNAELVETVAKLKERDDYDAVVIETTGVADPLPVAWTFFREQFVGSFRFGGIVTAVDALHFEAMNQAAIEVLLQIERADFLYITKIAATQPERFAALMELLPTLNPTARLIRDDDVDAVGLLFDAGDDGATLAELDDIAKRHEHKTSYDSLALELPEGASLGEMEDFFEGLPDGVFRAKAVFTDPAKGKAYALHAVHGRVEFYEWQGAHNPRAAVFIGKDFDKAALKAAFDKVRQKSVE